jgi:hypothetical protein
MIDEPRLEVWRFGSCIACGAADSWTVVAIPKLSTGELYPQFGICESCGHDVELSDLPPFLPSQVAG